MVRDGAVITLGLARGAALWYNDAMKKLSRLSRRSFLTRAGGAVALPWLVPASALGLDGKVAPSNRIVMGAIGLGGRGTGDLRNWVLPEKDVQFVAICDVRRERRDAIKDIVDKHYGTKDCAQYIDMKELLARKDIDAILTATGDRWHAGVSITAMRAGKDVYTEKPASMTVREGQAVVATAAKYKRVYQAGMQRLSEPNFVVCNELVRLGRLGEVKTVYAHLAPGGDVNRARQWLPAEPEPPREEVDWDAWLGPCAWRPYNKAYLHGAWHRDHDLYTGIIGEWGSHTFAQCHDAIACASRTAWRWWPCSAAGAARAACAMWAPKGGCRARTATRCQRCRVRRSSPTTRRYSPTTACVRATRARTTCASSSTR